MISGRTARNMNPDLHQRLRSGCRPLKVRLHTSRSTAAREEIMLRRTVMISAIASLVAATTCSAADWEDRLQKLYPAAKEEGSLIFNTERIEEVGGKEGLAEFQKRFPGIEITF